MKTTSGACAVGTPNGLTFFRGYVELWTSDEKMPAVRVWCKARRMAWETAKKDAETLVNNLPENVLNTARPSCM